MRCIPASRSLGLAVLHITTTATAMVFAHYFQHVQAKFPHALRNACCSSLDKAVAPKVKRSSVTESGGHDVSSQDHLLPGSVNGDGSPNGAYSSSPVTGTQREVNGYRHSAILHRDDVHDGILKYSHGGTLAALIDEEGEEPFLNQQQQAASLHGPSSPLVSIV